MIDTPLRGRGRPPVPEAERKRGVADRSQVKRDRRRAAEMLVTLRMTAIQQTRLDRLMQGGARPTASDLVAALTGGS